MTLPSLASLDPGLTTSGLLFISWHEELLNLLKDSNSSVPSIGLRILELLNPERQREETLVIGKRGIQNHIGAPVVLEALLNHIRTFGLFFQKVSFVNCKFSPECYKLFLKKIPECSQLMSLGFEECQLSAKEIKSLAKALRPLKQQLERITILHNPLDPPQDVTPLMKRLIKDNPAPPELILDHYCLTPSLSPAGGTMIPPHLFSPASGKNFPPPTLVKSPQENVLPPAKEKTDGILSYEDLREIISSSSGWMTLSEVDKWDELYTNSMKSLPIAKQELIFQLLLKKGYTITEAKLSPQELRQMSFFWCVAQSISMRDHKKLFDQTIEIIQRDIDDFTSIILNEEGFQFNTGHLLNTFLSFIGSGQGGENTILKALQRLFIAKGINSPIYIYRASAKAEISRGELLPPSYHRFEEAGTLQEKAITLYAHHDGTYYLLTKIQK